MTTAGRTRRRENELVLSISVLRKVLHFEKVMDHVAPNEHSLLYDFTLFSFALLLFVVYLLVNSSQNFRFLLLKISLFLSQFVFINVCLVLVMF